MRVGLRIRLLVLAMSAACLSACSQVSPSRPAIQAPVKKGDAARVHYLLLEGETGEAKKLLKQLLKQDPMDPTLMLLQQSLKTDPEELLGSKSYEYKVKPGETIDGLAERLLGNRFKAYQFVRYNDLKTPVRLQAGQTLRIPGERPATPKPAPVTKTQPQPDRAVPKAKEPPVVRKPNSDPAAAQRARSSGLAALNRGQPNQAVAHLKRAQSLDPTNEIIAKDLLRAQRIASTVNQRK